MVLRAWVCTVMLVIGCGGGLCPRMQHQDPTVALEAHQQRRDPVHAMRAEARVEQRGRKGRVRGTVLMFVERPDRVRFDAMTQFGPAAILTSDGRQFALTDLKENRYLTGPTCPENIARLVGIPMSAGDTALFLLGNTPVLPHADSSIVCEGGVYRVTLRAADGRRQEVDLAVDQADLERPPSEQRLQLLRSELYRPDGETSWRATYEDYRPVQGSGYAISMPYRVRVEQPGTGTDTLVRFKDVTLDPQVPEEAFAQSPRPGIQVEVVECDMPTVESRP